MDASAPQKDVTHPGQDNQLAEDVTLRKSSFCANSACVGVGTTADDTILVKDLKCPEQEGLSFTREEWTAFLQGVKAGEFDV